MKNIQNKTLLAVFAFCLCAIGFTSCKSDEVSLELPRLFRPINMNAELNKTVATISWAKVDSAVSYTLQISTDSIEFSSPVVDTTVTTLSVVKELAGETKFFARVRANSVDSAKASKFNSTLAFKTPAENLFLGCGININTGNLVNAYMTDVKTLTLSWTSGANVTHLILTSADGVYRDSVVISDEEKVAGQKVVSSLANSTWKVKVYNKTILRGTTYGLVEGDVALKAGDNLQTALTAATAGQVILLAGDATYTIGTAVVPLKSIKLRGLSTTKRPVICMTSGATSTTTMFSFGAGTGAISMENIDFTGYCENNTASTKVGYLFNNNIASATVSKLGFVNCYLRNFGNTPFRLQGTKAQSVDTVSLNGCVINDIGFSSTYAIVNSNTNDLFNNIIFTNSTFYNFKGSLILRTAQTINSISITNCNVYKAMQDSTSARYLLDLNTATFTGGITIKNCILGKSALNKVANTSFGANGYRGTFTLPATLPGCYYTSDYVDDPVTVVSGAVSTSIKSKMTPYSGTSTALWNDPVNGDFTFKDSSFAGKSTAGDPRWK